MSSNALRCVAVSILTEVLFVLLILAACRGVGMNKANVLAFGVGFAVVRNEVQQLPVRIVRRRSRLQARTQDNVLRRDWPYRAPMPWWDKAYYD